MPNDVERICRSLALLSLVELHRLRRQTLDWRVKAAVSRCLWARTQKRTEVGSTKATQLDLFKLGPG